MASKQKAPKQQQQQVASNEPWGGIKPYLSQLYSGAQNDILNNPQEFYGGRTYADPSQQTLSAVNQTQNFAQQQLNAARGYQTDPAFGQARGYFNDVIGGKYLDQANARGGANPYLEGLSQSLGDTAQQQIGARFAGSGRAMGSPGEVQQFQRDLTNTLAPHMFADATAQNQRAMQERAMERGYMQQAAGALPELAGAQQSMQDAAAQRGYGALASLGGVGSYWDQQAQLPIQEAMARHQFQQQEPFQRYQQYGQLLGMGSPYTTQNQTTTSSGGPGGMSPMAGALAGAGTGAAAGAAFGPWGAGIGGGIGLLGGFFSDRRLKRDVRRVGARRGIPVYRFKYLWSDQVFIGHMSDEVRTVAPWAVGTIGGYDFVQYWWL